MSDAAPPVCTRCSRPLPEADVRQGRAMRLLGGVYCGSCLEAMTPTCHQCRKALHEADFPAGRAFTLQGVRFCDGCMEEAVSSTPDSPVLRVEKPDLGGRSRRAAVRFVPPKEASLVLKPLGLRGLLRSNVVRLWIDVSEGGLRCIVQGGLQVGDLVHGNLSHPELDQPVAFRGMVRHARPWDKPPGGCVLGVRFEDPSALLQAFIRDCLARDPGLMTLNPPTPKPRPPSSRSA